VKGAAATGGYENYERSSDFRFVGRVSNLSASCHSSAAKNLFLFCQRSSRQQPHRCRTDAVVPEPPYRAIS